MRSPSPRARPGSSRPLLGTRPTAPDAGYPRPLTDDWWNLPDTLASRAPSAASTRCSPARTSGPTCSPATGSSSSTTGTAGGRAAQLDFDQRDVGVRIGTDPLGAQRAAVGQPNIDPIRGLDDVVIGEDVSGFVDDESGSGAAPRSLTVALRAGGRNPSGLSGSSMSRRRRVRDPSRVVASILTTAGLSCSAMSANEPVSGPVVAVAVARSVATRAGGADCAGVGIVEPATMRPTRKDTVATRQTVTNEESPRHCDHYRPQDSGSGRIPAIRLGIRNQNRNQGQQVSFSEHRHAQRFRPSPPCCPPRPRR